MGTSRPPLGQSCPGRTPETAKEAIMPGRTRVSTLLSTDFSSIAGTARDLSSSALGGARSTDTI